MEQKRPYWKVIVSLAFSLLATFLTIFIGVKAISYFMPFVIAWIIAAISNPVVCWLEKRIKIKKKIGSVLMIILVLAAVVGIFYLVISGLVKEARGIIESFPEWYAQITQGIQEGGEKFSGIIHMLPQGIQNAVLSVSSNLDGMASKLISQISEPTVDVAGRFVKSVPSALLNALVTFLAAYFFIAEREETLAWAKKVTPEPIVKRVGMMVRSLKKSVGGYFKAQLQIMVVVFGILLVGFLLIGQSYSGLLALLIAILDFLPFFGTGTALWPWMVYKVIVGDYKTAIFLLIIYVVALMTHQLLQPKLIGDHVGLKPLPTLVFLYIGWQIGSVMGIILAVPVGMILINMYEAGAFDYILDDVKILLKGILGLRK